MKTLLLSLTCVTGLVASAGAQVFQPQTARNILVGSIAGAIIGENNDKPLEGALIGAAAGALWSAATVPSRHERTYAPPVPQASVYYETSYGYQPVCRPSPPPRVLVVPQRCDPPRRTVVVVDRYHPRHVEVHSHGHHHDRRSVGRHYGHHHHRNDRTVYVRPGYGGRR
jgi:hypothetical protein